jgi:predicted nucleic acid-binding Zn ribbon protein
MMFVDNIYYRIYKIILGNKYNDNPVQNAVIIFFLIHLWNWVVVILLAKYFFGINTRVSSKYIVGALGIGICYLAYKYFSARHESIVEKYNNESLKQSRQGAFLLWTYIILTVISSVVVIKYFT